MTETTERFMQEIASRVGYDRVAELYLFPVIRQGGVEGAVAVVAAYPDPVAEPERTATSGDVDAGAPESVESAGSVDSSSSVEPVESVEEAQVVEAADPADPDAQREDAEPVSSDEGVVPAEAEAPHRRSERTRHVVYTARYRHTIKGTDRGRWVVEVVAEADAPLITVEEVVRGVVRRSGEAFQPERISGDQFRAIVPAPAAPESAPA